MRTLYFDAFAGISGDMTVGALIDIGVPLDVVRESIALLPISGYRLETEAVKKQGIAASQFHVRLEAADQPHRHYGHIVEMIEKAPLKERVKELALRIFKKLGEAEGKVHGVPLERVHFHEVGAIDSIVDIVGCAIALDWLKVERIVCSPLPYGSGFVDTAHGRLPVPPPAVAELLREMPVHGDIGPGERVTPTGAAIVAALSDDFGPMPGMRMEKVGYGSGTKDFPDRPNLLRLVVGESATGKGEEVLVIECHIDDMPPEAFGFLMERLFEGGALDVGLIPMQMKKNRPGTRLTVIANNDDLDRLAGIILRESTTIGVRYYPARRITLPRHSEVRETTLGPVQVKVIGDGRVSPEYEDCRRIAVERGIPLIEVFRIVERETWQK